MEKNIKKNMKRKVIEGKKVLIKRKTLKSYDYFIIKKLNYTFFKLFFLYNFLYLKKRNKRGFLISRMKNVTTTR